jgi:hypothetical protein
MLDWAYLGIYDAVLGLRGPHELSTAVQSQYVYYEPELLTIHDIISVLWATRISVKGPLILALELPPRYYFRYQNTLL